MGLLIEIESVDQGVDLQEFFDSTAHLFKTPYGKSVGGTIQDFNRSKSPFFRRRGKNVFATIEKRHTLFVPNTWRFIVLTDYRKECVFSHTLQLLHCNNQRRKNPLMTKRKGPSYRRIVHPFSPRSISCSHAISYRIQSVSSMD